MFERLKKREKYPESDGYYERVPIRVDQYSLVKNKEDKIVFETTDKEICDGHRKNTVKIKKDDDNGWSVILETGAYTSPLVPGVDLHREKLARRRVMWHACQYMLGRDLSNLERYSISRRQDEEADLFKDDAFFGNDGNPVTTDPFGKVLQD